MSEAQIGLPYYYLANGECPPWFVNGSFEHELFDASMPYTPKGSTYILESHPDKKIENPYDLRNLRIIDPAEVVRAVQELEDANRQDRRPAICVIGTGGTIASAMVGDELVPAIDVSEIFDYVGRFYRRKYSYTAFSFPKLIDSSQMKLDYDADMVIAMSYMWRKMSADLRKNFYGFIISHGTDTFGQSLTRVAQMLGPNLDFSVAGVAAQDNIEEEFNDVADNMGRAIASLSRLYAVGRKVVGGFVGGSAGGLYNPNGMLKISDTDIKGFDSPALDLIIDASNTRRAKRVVTPFQDAYSQERHPQLDAFHPIVMRGTLTSRLIEAQMDIPRREYEAQVKNYPESVIAIITKTYGSFTFDRGQVDDIVKGVTDRGMMLFGTNPFPTGEVSHKYGDALYLTRFATPLYMMPHAAAVKLMYGEYVYGRDTQLLEAFMTANNSGEQPHHIWTPRPLGEHLSMRPLGQPRESIPVGELEVYPA